jgi:hypothetical protein
VGVELVGKGAASDLKALQARAQELGGEVVRSQDAGAFFRRLGLDGM